MNGEDPKNNDVDETDAPDPCGGEVERNWRAKSARADKERGGGFELFLPRQTDFGDEQVARVAQKFLI